MQPEIHSANVSRVILNSNTKNPKKKRAQKKPEETTESMVEDMSIQGHEDDGGTD